jgi:phospholipase C
LKTVKFTYAVLLILLTASACVPTATPTPEVLPVTITPEVELPPVQTDTPTPTETIPLPTDTLLPSATPTPVPPVPNFSHIVIIVLENREFDLVIGNPQAPNFNGWAAQYTLLTQHYAIRHPSLPNYIALIGGDTLGIDSNCWDCFVDTVSLPDLIEASGRTWKTYQEAMPEPCYLMDTSKYVRKHNPFIYFDSIRLDEERCRTHVVPLTDLEVDLANGSLPDFIFITPDICNSAHDCEIGITDAWLGKWVDWIMSNPQMAKDGLIILTWDEGQGDHGCCGVEPGGGRIATILISQLARSGFQDDTPYTLYALLKMIAAAWDLPLIGHAADESTALIEAPWQKEP